MGEIRNAEGQLIGGTPTLAMFKGNLVEWYQVRNDPEFQAEAASRHGVATEATIQFSVEQPERGTN